MRSLMNWRSSSFCYSNVQPRVWDVRYFFLPAFGALSKPWMYLRGIWYCSVTKPNQTKQIIRRNSLEWICWTELYLVAVCRHDAPGCPGSAPAAALWLQGHRGGQNWLGLDAVVCLLPALALNRTPPDSLLLSPEHTSRIRPGGGNTVALRHKLLNRAEAVNQSDPYLLVRASGGYSDIDGLHLPFPDHRSLTWKLQLMAQLHPAQCPANTAKWVLNTVPLTWRLFNAI